MFLAFRDAEARDWRSNLAIALGHRGAQHRLQFHHIFPKTVLRGSYTSREADDIANLAFISGKTNRQISDKPPSQYFPQLVKKSGIEAFQAQCRGTRVTFTIPVADDAVSGAAAGPARPTGDSREAGRERTCILVVDDDPETLRYVRDTLTDAGYAPQVTGDPEDVPRLIETKKPALVLRDLVLPGTDGIALMERIPELADLPVIFISGYGRDQTIAKALEAGAADYVVKPFSPTELVARIQAALRGRATPPEPYRLGDLAIHYEERRVTVAGRPVPLTVTEYDLVRALSVNAGRVLTHASLLRRVCECERNLVGN